MEWKDFIVFLLYQFNTSSYKLEKENVISAGTISNIKNGYTKHPTRDTVKALENYFKIKIDYRDPNNVTFRLKSLPEIAMEAGMAAQLQAQTPIELKLNTYPIISIVGAGSVNPFDDSVENVQLPYSDPNCSALRVLGDSMAPRIENGDIVLIHNAARPKPQDIVAIRTTGGEQMIKILLSHDTAAVALFSQNPAYPIINIRADHIASMLKVVACFKTFIT